jgi:hypothetical protein
MARSHKTADYLLPAKDADHLRQRGRAKNAFSGKAPRSTGKMEEHNGHVEVGIVESQLVPSAPSKKTLRSTAAPKNILNNTRAPQACTWHTIKLSRYYHNLQWLCSFMLSFMYITSVSWLANGLPAMCKMPKPFEPESATQQP